MPVKQDPILLRRYRREFVEKVAKFDIQKLLEQMKATGESGGEADDHAGQQAAGREMDMLMALGKFLFPDAWESAHREFFQCEGLVDQLSMGEIGEVEFTELALDHGMSLERIGKTLAQAREE